MLCTVEKAAIKQRVRHSDSRLLRYFLNYRTGLSDKALASLPLVCAFDALLLKK